MSIFYINIKILLFIGIIFIFSGCSKQLVRNYYVIDYVVSDSVQANLRKKNSKRLLVRELEISPIYDTSQIVIRKSMHQLQYSSYALWPIRPQYAIRDLLIKHIRVRNIFNEVDKEFINNKPDYVIKGNLYAIEFYYNEQINYMAAILEMKLLLVDNNTGEIIVDHTINRNMELASTDISFFVKTISQLLQDEHELFIKKIFLFCANEKKSN